MVRGDLCDLSSRAALTVITLGNAGVSQLTRGKTMKSVTSSARVIAAGAVGIIAAAILTAAPASAVP